MRVQIPNYYFCSSSSKLLSSCVKTVWSNITFLIASIHWLVTLISWQLNLIVFDNILFDDGLSCAKLSSLSYSSRVVICFRDEAVISWNVRSSFSCSCGQFMVFVECFCCICGELVSWIVSIST